MTKRYVRTGRTAKKIAAREEKKKEIEALSHIPEPVVIPEPPKTVQRTISPTFAETFEKKFEAISRAARQSLVTAQKVHAHIDQLPEEQYREKLHRETSEITNQLITDLMTELDALATTIPPEATTLRKTVETYREPFIKLISSSPEPEETHTIKPIFS